MKHIDTELIKDTDVYLRCEADGKFMQKKMGSLINNHDLKRAAVMAVNHKMFYKNILKIIVFKARHHLLARVTSVDAINLKLGCGVF